MSANQINKGREKSLPLNSQSKILELQNITKKFGPADGKYRQDHVS